MWRTHHGLLGACRGAIKRERWRDRGCKRDEERERKMVKRGSFLKQSGTGRLRKRLIQFLLLSSCSSVCLFLAMLDKLFLL